MIKYKRLSRETTADATHDAKAFVLKVNQCSDELLTVYMNLYKTLNELYAEFPQMYEEIQRTVALPTNEDAERVTRFNSDLKEVMEFFNDEQFLSTVVNDGDVETSEAGEEEDS